MTLQAYRKNSISRQAGRAEGMGHRAWGMGHGAWGKWLRAQSSEHRVFSKRYSVTVKSMPK